MSILDRKPKKYSTSDLFWIPNSAPTDGVVGDINTMKLDPSHIGMGQDVIIDSSGVLRSRGSFNSYTADALTNLKWLGLIELVNGQPAGTSAPSNAAILFDSSTSSSYIYGCTTRGLTGWAKLSTRSPLGTLANQTISENNVLTPSIAKLKDDMGAIMCFNHSAGSAAVDSWSYPLLWGGNAVTTTDVSVGTAASTVGTKGVTGVGTAWTTALEGCYLFIGAAAASSSYVGQVRQVNSATQLNLHKGALATCAANLPKFKTTREPTGRVYKGRITTTTTSTSVVGSGTKFVSSGPAGSGGTYLTTSVGSTVFRYADGGYIGKVSSVQNDTTLTLTGNAAIALNNEEYFIVINDGVNFVLSAGDGFGNFSATCVELYADRYFYGNIAAQDQFIKANSFFYNSVTIAPFIAMNAIMFSKKGDPEMLDMSPNDGDIIRIPTAEQPDMIRALCATRGGLVIFRLYDTWLLTGYSPETFRLVKIVDDGTWSNVSYKPYKDGVVWCGTKSAYYFDGTRVVDLLSNKIKRFYRRSNITALTYPLGLAVAGDHVMFSYSLDTNSDRTWPYKNTTRTLQTATIAINMLNGAVTFFTNAYITNSVVDSTGKDLILMWDKLINGQITFDESTTAANNNDAVQCTIPTFTSGVDFGPDIMFETVKLANGNAARMKFFKMLLMNYSSDIGLTCMVNGVNNTSLDFPNRGTGTVTTVTFPISANVGVLKRIKFLIRAPQLIIRVYATNAAGGGSQRFKMFWYAVGGKWMRWGRAQ